MSDAKFIQVELTCEVCERVEKILMRIKHPEGVSAEEILCRTFIAAAAEGIKRGWVLAENHQDWTCGECLSKATEVQA